MEVGLDLFMPEREMSRSGSTAGGAPGIDATVKSDDNQFYVPEFGYNRAISDTMGVGLSVYGNGGLNTNYAGGQTNCTGAGAGANKNALCGNGRLGIDMMQLIVAPTFAYKFSSAHSVGVSPLLVHQQFKATGLQFFQQLSSSQNNVTDNGYDTSNGVGVRIGYLGKLSDSVSVGVAYAPKISMSKLEKYKGLFADGGNFDIPENYNVGATFRATPTVAVSAEYGVIKYSAVPSVGNPSTSAGQLGTANGRGFGWVDINIYKLGMEWQQSGNMTWRAGINVGDNPVQSRDVTFNILAPGVITTHYTLGGTYTMSKQSELTFAYMYAPSNSVSGTSLFTSLGVNGGNETIKMSQQSLGVQYGWKY